MSKIDDFFGRQHNLGEATKNTYLFALSKFEELAKNQFEKVFLDQNEVHRVLNLLSNVVSASSWNLYLMKYKRLAKFLYDSEDEEAPKLWRKIKPKKIDWEKKLKDKWLTKKQFYKLLDVIDHPRDKAMYGVAVEGALRSGELLGLRLKDVQQTSYGYDIAVSGKTGSSTFPVVLFAPLLTQWLNQHPFKRDLNAPLWTQKIIGKGETEIGALGKDGAFSSIRKYAKRAGLPKISLHWLRHTKITWTAKDKKTRISDEMAKKMFRWGKNSSMFSRYTHLHGTDSKNAFLSLAGIKTEEETIEDKTLDPKKCLNCNTLNSATMLYCGKCGFVLKEEEAKRQVAKQKLLEEMMKAYQERIQHQENQEKKIKKI